MGFLSGLGKILGGVGAVAAAPFTGGASLGALGPILATVGKVGGAVAPILGGAAAGRAQGRQQEESAQLQRDALALRRWQMEQDQPRQLLNQSLLGSIAANVQPFHFGQMTPGMGLQGQRPGSTGGLNPSVISPETRQMAQAIIQQNLAKQMSGAGGPPPISGAPQSGFLDKALGVGSFASGILGGLGKAGVFNPRPGAMPNPVPGTADSLPDMIPRMPSTIDIGIPQPPLLPSRRIRVPPAQAPGAWRMY